MSAYLTRRYPVASMLTTGVVSQIDPSNSVSLQQLLLTHVEDMFLDSGLHAQHLDVPDVANQGVRCSYPPLTRRVPRGLTVFEVLRDVAAHPRAAYRIS